MMEALEIELAYLPKLLDEDVRRVAHQHFHWDMLLDCADLFGLDIDHINYPLDDLPDLILRKSDEYLSKEQAQAFQRVWGGMTQHQQIYLTLQVLERS
jgi:hypothetical protein